MTKFDVGARIRELRKSRRLSAAKLAQQLGYSQETIYCWEWGERIPRIDQVEKIAEHFGLTLAQMVDGEPLPRAPAA